MLTDEGEHFPHLSGGGEGTKVFRPVTDHPSGQEHPRKGFMPDNDERIGLVILQVDVEPRLEFLDEAVLKQQSVLFRRGNGEINTVNAPHQLRRFSAGLLSREIRTYPLADVLGLADIY